jgi:DNA-binding SARP family transcriptional activator/TolB-like protein
MNVNARRPMSHATTSQAQTALSEPVMVRLRLIGQMEAWTISAENILPSGRKTRGLLSILALSAPRPVLRGRLAEMLWSRRPEEQARASLRQEIHRLLDALGPVGDQILSITRDHLMLRPGMVWIDVEEVLRASPNKPTALCLLDGDLLEDLDGIDPAFDTWLATERERLRDRARVLAEQMLRDQSDPDVTIPAAQQLLSIDRAHEGAWRALMRAYTTRGERGMAIQAFERCRSVLADMLDAQPSEETQRLAAEIRASAAQARPPGPVMQGATNVRADLVRDLRQHSRGPSPDSRHDPRTELRPDPRIETRQAQPRSNVRVGVMPLQLAGMDDSQTHLASGIADEITSALSRSRWMSLVSAAALGRMATQTREETAIRRAFNVDFLLDGSLQREGGRLRISLHLLDLRAGNQLVWTRRFDREMQDLLSLQDEIASEVSAQLEPEILLLEAARVTARPLPEPSAYELMLRAVPLLGRMEKQAYMMAGTLLHEAMAQEPEYAAATSWAAYWHLFLIGQGWAADAAAAKIEATRLAERAMMLDPQDARALSIAGHVRAYLHHRPREALSLHERALTLNPNLAMAWSLSGIAHMFLGNMEEAERRLRHGKLLSPLDPHSFMHDSAIVTIHLLKHDHVTAVRVGREASEMNSGFAAACKPYLAALGHLGDEAEAEVVRKRLLSILPGFTLTGFLASSPFEREQDTAHFAEGLRLAGIPG